MDNNYERMIKFLKELREKLIKLLFESVPENEEEIEDEEKPITRKKEKKKIVYPNNYIDFPFNIYEPDEIVVDDDTYTRYRVKFNSLYDLYEYLKSEPRLNHEVFKSLESVENDSDFAGVSYEEALEDLINPPRTGFRSFLKLTDKLNNEALGYVKEYVEVKSPAGGTIDIPSYVSGNPYCFKTTKSIRVRKFLRINIMLSYYSGTTKDQVLNRALIIAALVNAFEQAGYVIEINTFEVSRCYDEIIDIDVNIKGNSETFNKAALYKSLCYVEFLRRILFRILETLDVKNDWYHGYGVTCSESFIRKAKRFDDNDIFFDQPRDMGILGHDIKEDFENAIKHLKLEDKIDVELAKKEFNKDIKKLRKTIK